MTSMYYVYAHARNDTNVLFYIGKGKSRRAWETRGRNRHWKNIAEKHGWHVILFARNLTEQHAFEIERILIRTIGRDKLVNHTDGGDGMSGFIMPDTVKAKIAASHVGLKPSEATRRKLAEYRRGRRTSTEVKKAISLSLRGNTRARNVSLRIFYHPINGLFTGTMHNFMQLTNEHPTKLVKGTKLHIKGWVYLGIINQGLEANRRPF